METVRRGMVYWVTIGLGVALLVFGTTQYLQWIRQAVPPRWVEILHWSLAAVLLRGEYKWVPADQLRTALQWMGGPILIGTVAIHSYAIILFGLKLEWIFPVLIHLALSATGTILGLTIYDRYFVRPRKLPDSRLR